MMECPAYSLLETNRSLYCPQGPDKLLDNIYPKYNKIGASFDPEKGKMVDVCQMHNLDYGLKPATQRICNAPDGRAYC